MSALSFAALVGWALLAAPADAAVLSPLPTCETGTRYVELTVDAPRAVHEVCIHLGLSTSFFFDSKLARVELAGRERFRVMEAEAGFALIPTEAVVDGERVLVTVYFQDGAAPSSAAFWLVMHPTAAERQVEVTRHPRTLASYRDGEQQARAEVRQCQEEKARLQSEYAGPVGLTGLIARRLVGEGGVTFKDLKDDVTARPGNRLQLQSARSYRSDTESVEGGRKVVRLAVELESRNTGTRPWTPADAALVESGRHAELKVLNAWPREPLAPGEMGRVVVELEAPEDEARGTFTLELRSQEDGARGELLDGVTFP